MLVRLRRGSTLITLSGGGTIAACTYVPRSPDIDEQQVRSMLRSGGDISALARRNVTESASVILTGTATEILAQVRALEALFPVEESERRSASERVYIEFRIQDTGDIYRSEILVGRVEWPDRPIGPRLSTGAVELIVLWTRRYFWEDTTLRPIQMTSGTTTSPTSGYVTIYNNDDVHATQQNWFQIGADQIGGVIPAPLKLYIRNNSAGSRSARAFYIGNYVFSGPPSLDPIFRDVNATGSTTSWTSSLETSAYYWSLSDGNLINGFQGQFGRILAVFSSRPAPTTLVRATMQYRQPIPVLDIAVGEQILAGTNYVVDLGGIPIPPGDRWENMGSLLYLTLKAKAATGAGDSLAIDWVQVMPSGMGCYRVIKAIGASWALASGDQLVDDGDDGGVFSLESGAATAIPGFRPFFSPIHVWPNRLQRLRLIVQGNVSMETGHAWQVKAEYRPRRLTV